MFEIDDEARRNRELRRLTGVENHIYMDVGGLRVAAVVPYDDVERTKADGKTSSVHFLHFPFTAAEIEKFRDPKVQVLLAIAHPNYGHMRSEEHTSELQSLMRISYAVFCLKKNNTSTKNTREENTHSKLLKEPTT